MLVIDTLAVYIPGALGATKLNVAIWGPTLAEAVIVCVSTTLEELINSNFRSAACGHPPVL
jgi:hypothetical protein